MARMATLLAILVYASLSSAQAAWDADQVSTTLCYWEQPRAALVRDTVYLDGGYIWWLPGLKSGGYGSLVSDNNPLGLVYTLNFSVAFDIKQNITAILGTIPKTGGNGGAANNLAPNYYDGAMLGNDAEWFLYGGVLRRTAAFVSPHADDVTSYQAYQYGVQKDSFRPGFLNVRLPDDLDRYLAYGGAANAPSENKAWYFSGMHTPVWGDIFPPSLNKSTTASEVSNTFITLDMETQQQEKWTNVTLPPKIHGRANPELVWVPIGAQGILVALGGVLYPEFLTSAHQSENTAASKKDSPVFMSTIDIYDVASGDWYQQDTSGGPGALTRGCAVVAPAQDSSSFNIYYYGGYDGLNLKEDFNDDVWVLSLPSFTWTKVATGTAGHGRAGQKCFMPYPDQMMIIGGSSAMPGGSPTCLKDGVIQIFNLTSAEWMTRYDPADWGEYGVPEAVRRKIGGSATGGATLTTPSPAGWGATGLSKVFETPYPATKLTTYYPYASAGPNNNTNPDFVPDEGKSSTPAYLAPVLGSVLGAVFLALIGVGVLLWRKRRLLKLRGTSETGTEDSKGNRIISWIRGQPAEHKAPPTVTTEETPMSPEMTTPSIAVSPAPAHTELPETYIAELDDTSPRPELQDTGLSPLEIINKHTHFAPNSIGGTPSNPSAYNSISVTDQSSTLSRGSVMRASSTSIHPDSPQLGPTELPTGARQEVVSGVSEVSEQDRGHLRQISNATVSSEGTAPRAAEPAAGGVDAVTEEEEERPTPGSGTGGSGAAAPTPRRSVFFENQDDLGGKGT